MFSFKLLGFIDRDLLCSQTYNFLWKIIIVTEIVNVTVCTTQAHC